MLQSLTASYSQLLGAGLIFTIVVLAVYLLRRRMEDHRAKHKLADYTRLELHLPNSLHPVIDPDICIGSGSCITACPEGKILGLVNGIATLLNGSKCIGHGKCAVECPVDAIRLVFGMEERGVDLPEVDEYFETARPGVHIVGELAGMGLIKNALRQGLQVAARLKETIDAPAVAGAFDVAIVGAGPAGIATAVGVKAAGLSYVLMEQDTVGGTVAHYPRQKLVMTETIDLPFYGPFGQKLIRKENLIESFEGVIKKADLKVHEKTKLTAIGGEKDAFTVTTDKGIFTTKRVVLAIGRRGTPRKLGVPGEDLEKVAYRLIDARQYAGKKVLVVGGGDSALEAAIQLADDTDAEVGISYRRPEFGRCRPLNKEKIDAHLKSGRVKSYMGTELVSVDAASVTLKTKETTTIPNDFIIACLGGELPNEMLKTMGISIRKHLGDKAMANPAVTRRKKSKHAGRIASALFFLLGTTVVARADLGRLQVLSPAARPALQVARPRDAETVGAVGPRDRDPRDDVHAAELRLPDAQAFQDIQGQGVDRALAALPRLRRRHEPDRHPVSHRVSVGQPAGDHHVLLGADRVRHRSHRTLHLRLGAPAHRGGQGCRPPGQGAQGVLRGGARRMERTRPHQGPATTASVQLRGR